jgi:phosphoribosylanthranilate isomerase
MATQQSLSHRIVAGGLERSNVAEALDQPRGEAALGKEPPE